MNDAPEIVHETVIDEVALAKRRSQRIRLVGLGVFFVASLVTVHATGLTEKIDVEAIRAFTESWGIWGILVYFVAFALGVLVSLPGLAFVGAASVAYGQALGMLVGYLGAVGAASVSFVLVRAVGGQPLGDVKRPWMRKVLARLESHPITTIAILRALFFLASWLNYGCAMSSVRLRDYVIGSAIGLVPQAVAGALIFDWIAARFL